MKNETANLLAEMGFTSHVSKIQTRKASASLNLNLTVKRNGTTIIVFCNDGKPEFDLLANHGAVRRWKGEEFGEEIDFKSVCNGKVPYLTMPTARFIQVLQSIAFQRFLTSARKGESRYFATAKKLAVHWFNRLPSEENDLYSRDLALNEMEESLLFCQKSYRI